MGSFEKTQRTFYSYPFNRGNGINNGKIETLASNIGFLLNSKEDYVVISDSDVVYNIDIQSVIKSHIEKSADITMVYKSGDAPKHMGDKFILDINKSRHITGVIPDTIAEHKCAWSMHIYVMGRKFLIEEIERCMSLDRVNFKRDILTKNIEEGKVYGYKFDGWVGVINSVNQYFEANMELLNSKVRKDLFNPERPIYTKVRDEMPAKYGLGSLASNCLIADGCVIDGQVSDCILARGVKVSKGAVLKNCIIMQNCQIGENCELENVIIDKNAVLKEGRKLVGFNSYPVYVSKGSIV